MRELYIYYRVDDAHVAAARLAVQAMHDRLRQAHPGLVARLLIRVGEGSCLQTWMEIYSLPCSTRGVDGDLEAGIEAGAATWAHLVSGSRHCEAFIATGDD